MNNAEPEERVTKPEERVMQICVCDEGWCFCNNTTQMLIEDAMRGVEWTCPECKAGRHVWTPDGARE